MRASSDQFKSLFEQEPFLKLLPDDEEKWDPDLTQRVLVRSRTTGDLGWFVVRDWEVHIKLDRPSHDLTYPYSVVEWNFERERRPFTIQQVAQIAFEADKQLCRLLGEHAEARRDWLDLSNEKRNKFASKGPGGAPIRRDMWKNIMGFLRPHAR